MKANQPNKNSTIKTAEKVVEELNKSKTVTQIWKACNKPQQD